MAEYRNYALEQVRDVVPDLKGLKILWQDRHYRQQIRNVLEGKGVHPTALRVLFEAPESDEYDLLAHLGANAPLITRDDRVNMFLNQHVAILEKYPGKQREVLEALLEKYRRYGIKELESSDVFDLTPLREYGSFSSIAAIFGGVTELQNAVLELDKTLYA